MGIGGIGIWQLLIILLIVVMLFGTKKLRTLGSDLGGALKGFKTAMKEDEGEAGASGEGGENGESGEGDKEANTVKSEQAETEDKTGDSTAKS